MDGIRKSDRDGRTLFLSTVRGCFATHSSRPPGTACGQRALRLAAESKSQPEMLSGARGRIRARRVQKSIGISMVRSLGSHGLLIRPIGHLTALAGPDMAVERMHPTRTRLLPHIQNGVIDAPLQREGEDSGSSLFGLSRGRRSAESDRSRRTVETCLRTVV